MTDEELLTGYREAKIKALYLVKLALSEGTDLENVTDRLRRLGVDARPGLRKAFGRNSTRDIARQITQEEIDEYLRKYGQHPDDEKPKEGCVDDFCKNGDGQGPCRYLETAYGYVSCAYFTTMGPGHRRGCPAGRGCIRYEARRRRRKEG